MPHNLHAARTRQTIPVLPLSQSQVCYVSSSDSQRMSAMPARNDYRLPLPNGVGFNTPSPITTHQQTPRFLASWLLKRLYSPTNPLALLCRWSSYFDSADCRKHLYASWFNARSNSSVVVAMPMLSTHTNTRRRPESYFYILRAEKRVLCPDTAGQTQRQRSSPHIQQRSKHVHERVWFNGQVGRQPLASFHLLGNVVCDHDRDRLKAVTSHRGVRLGQ